MMCAEDRSSLPNNYFSALVQLKPLERFFNKDPELEDHYEQKSKTTWIKVTLTKSTKQTAPKLTTPREWYLPHHPVVHPHKPSKVRTDLNGAAKLQGQSLNNGLLNGPDLLQSLIHVLICFRQFKCAVFADVKGMFLQVGVLPRDRPSLRFLWRDHPACEIAYNTSIRRLDHVRQLRVDTHRYRQPKRLSVSSSKCPPKLPHGRLLGIKSYSGKRQK